jgi:hypothetical protein
MVHHPSEVVQQTRAAHLLEIDRLLHQPEPNRTAIECALAASWLAQPEPPEDTNGRDRESSLWRPALNP